MKMLAGKLLNHRKPTHAPTRHAASIVRSRWPLTVMNVIPMYASSTIAAHPAASPSSPSVRLTALVVPGDDEVDEDRVQRTEVELDVAEPGA